MNKKGFSLASLVLLVLLVILAYFGTGFLIYLRYNQNCLREIAIKECEERNLEIYSNLIVANDGFDCVEENERTPPQRFRFFEEELKDCKKNYFLIIRNKGRG